MSKSKSLSWCDRLALIEHYKPTDAEIITILDVTQPQLDTARDLQSTGTLVPTPNLDVDSYGKMFGVTTPVTKTPVASIVKPSSNQPAQTANRPIRVPKKRGRKGSAISDAFNIIPEVPVPAEQFAADNKISIAVLRQSKRFDSFPEKGIVHVAKSKTTKQLEVWRTKPVTS